MVTKATTTVKVDTTNIDYDKLKSGLNNLTGRDFEEAERAARALGDTSPEITFSKRFQCILAAKALGMIPDDIQDLKIADYTAVTLTVFNFLAGSMGTLAQ